MLTEYIQAALETATYKIIKNEEKYFGSIPSLKGVWATGKTLEECRENLKSALEDCVLVHISRNIPLPAVKGVSIKPAMKIEIHA